MSAAGTPALQHWKNESRSFMRTMYKYYMTHPDTVNYFTRHGVTVKTMLEDPAVMDRAFIGGLKSAAAAAEAEKTRLGASVYAIKRKR